MLAGASKRPRQPKPDAGGTNGQAVFDCDLADGLEIAVEYGVDDRGADALPCEVGKTRAHRIRAARWPGRASGSAVTRC